MPSDKAVKKESTIDFYKFHEDSGLLFCVEYKNISKYGLFK